MIQKAYIVAQIDSYTYTVRVPRYNKSASSPTATPTEQLATASVCCLPGVHPYYDIDDIVFVEFENDELGSPVILGQLFRENNTVQSHCECDVSDINVSDNCQLPSKINVGTNALNDSHLEGLVGSIQGQIDLLADKVRYLA